MSLISRNSKNYEIFRPVKKDRITSLEKLFVARIYLQETTTKGKLQIGTLNNFELVGYFEEDIDIRESDVLIFKGEKYTIEKKIYFKSNYGKIYLK